MHDEFEFNPKGVMVTDPIYGFAIAMARNLLSLAAGSLLASATGGAATATAGAAAGAAAGGSGLLSSLGLIGAGGALGGLLGGEKTSTVDIPDEAIVAMRELLKIGQTPLKFPTQGTAQIDPNSAEGKSLAQLTSLIGSGPSSSFEDAKSRITSFLDQPADFSQRPEFQAILRASQEQGNEAVNQVLRRIQLGGLSSSTPQGKALGRTVARSQENLVGQLAPFAESERTRRFQALQQLLNIGQFETQLPFQQAQAGLTLDPTRRIADTEQSRIHAGATQNALAPFQQADVFGKILGAPAAQPIVTDPSSSTPFSNAVGGAEAFQRIFSKAA